MKKRILALALAGTTAFSVFGAAMSASAAGSSHVVYGNDPYVTYDAAEVTITANEDTYKHVKTGVVISKEDYAKLPAEKLTYTDKSADLSDAKNDKIWNDAQTAAGYTWLGDVKPTIYRNVDVDGDATYFIKPTTSKDVALTYAEYLKEVDAEHGYVKYEENGRVYTFAEIKADVVAKIGDYTWQGDYVKNDNGLAKVDAAYGEGKATQYGAGELVTAELSRDGVTVENGNVYAYDYYTSGSKIAEFAAAWDDANMIWNPSFNLYMSTDSSDVKPLAKVIANIGGDYVLDNVSDIVTGKGGYNDNRGAVVDEYEEFLYDLGLLKYQGYNLVAKDASTLAVVKKELLASFNYKYNGRDEYNFEGLIDDIFKSVGYGYVVNDQEYVNYIGLSSSNLVYLMQQYDKYTDGSYIQEADDIGGSRWADLLISALEAVSADDFRSGYNGYAAQAAAAIDKYNAATTAGAQAAAIQGLYNVVTGSYGRSSGVEKADLVDTLNSLYFNNKNIPATYMPAVKAEDTNAAIPFYGYAAAYDVVGTATETARNTTKAVYPLYPQIDYAEKNNTVATYIGNVGKYADTATDEYEWFVNVYELAAKINKMNDNGSYQGVVDTVNAALEEAVADLAVTSTPAGSTSMRLEEAVDAYDGKIESDYIEKYYDAFEKANAYADVVEGNMQTKYATEMVIISGETLGYQSAQVTVTKGDIKNLKSAIADAEKAVKAIKDSKDYKAAQVSALNKAIASAQGIVDCYDGITANSSVNHKATKTAGDKDAFVKSDVEAAIDAINAAINYSEVIMGWSQKDGKWMYGTDEGYLNNGWNKVGSVWYYFNEDGTAKQSEWYKEGNTWYYFNSNAGAARGWCKVDGEWYYFNDGCAMVTGWRKVDGSWYYLASSGKMTTGWVQVDGKWYYMSKESNSLGQMLANTTVEGYKLGADGAMIEK